jgi:hydrogenase expression/formation protein HypC
MCLGIPGQVVSVDTDSLGIAMGKVRFGGILKEVCLAYVPEAGTGDYVIVHAGFAISKVDEGEAVAVFALLRQMEQLQDRDGLPQGD